MFTHNRLGKHLLMGATTDTHGTRNILHLGVQLASTVSLTAMKVLRLAIRIVDSPTMDRQLAGQCAQRETVQSLQLHR